uniref:DUF2193 family protein n=1 Tax=Ferroglobus sp. TaxID=2614230 RepID=UPI0025BE3CFE
MIGEILNESLKLQEEAVKAVETHRFEEFKIVHAENFVEAVRNMSVKDGQSESALNLYRMSLINHYEISKSLTESVSPVESAFLEWMQTPVVMEILY